MEMEPPTGRTSKDLPPGSSTGGARRSKDSGGHGGGFNLLASSNSEAGLVRAGGRTGGFVDFEN